MKLATPIGVMLLSGITLLPAFKTADMNALQETQPTESVTTQNDNPLLKPWSGPYGGVPPFDLVKVEHFKPALEQAMTKRLAAIDAIANNKKAADFQNTIAELERTRNIMNPLMTVYGIWSGNITTPEFQKIEMEMAPALSAIEDKIVQNENLFRRIETVYNSRQKLTPEQQRLTWLHHNNFVRAGAKLNAQSKVRLSEINQELAKLFTRFRQNVLADETNEFIVIEKEADLAGLPASVVDAAAAEGEARKISGKWVISNTRSAIDPFLTYSENRLLREKAWKMFVNRGDNGNATDNNVIITRILKLRLERAKLLGYETHAHWRLENSMAKTPAKAMELLQAVWTPAVERVKEEVKDMQTLADREGARITIEPWDYHFYMEKVRKEKFALDENEIKPYLQLDKLRDGMFFVAGELFNFSFTPVTNVPVYHPNVTVFEVKDRTTGSHIALFYFDPFARPGKRSGAWMNAYRSQEKMDRKVTTIVSNNLNNVKGKAGEPVLISWDNAETLFHEFGHALHGLCSDVTYPSLSGTSVFRDYVEFPSQLLEHWLTTPEMMQRYAVHYQNGKPIPQELVDKIVKASTFKQGYATTEYLASALMDMKFHLHTKGDINPSAFEKETLSALGMPRELVMRHRSPQFLHIFSSDGYSAGYYSYLWADVLNADGFEAFLEEKGPYDKAVAARLRKHVLSAGNTVDPAEGYRQFRKRDASIHALMRERGFASQNEMNK
jgi:peptidyl-dipeptidase Dcp